MRVLASISIAAALAAGPTAATLTIERAEAVQAPTTVTRTVDTSGDVSTQGFIRDFNCFFFNRC
ncbi:hypothetical protein [Georgenia wangjunii]|uniref:hypothetical protein n=1 Tax=Georgenia wangjunii TaxID=3117730 RepID=UPI002F268AB6